MFQYVLDHYVCSISKKDKSFCNRDPMINLGIEIYTFITFFDNYFSCLEIFLASPLLIHVASVFYAFSSYIFIFFLPSYQEKLNQSPAIVPSILTAVISRSLVAASNQKTRCWVQKVQFMYWAQTISTHSEPAKTYTNTTSSRPANPVVTPCSSPTLVPDQCPNDQ